jgi:hypothetical protein
VKTPRPASKPSTAAAELTAAAEAKAAQEPPAFTAPETLPAPDGDQTTRSASTSPSQAARVSEQGAKEGEGPRAYTGALKTLPARSGSQTARPESTSPDGVLTARSGAKGGEEPLTVPAPQTLPAPGEHPTTHQQGRRVGVDQEQKAGEEEMAQALTARGYRTVTSETWTRQGNLDALREQRRRNEGDPRLAVLTQIARKLADRMTEFTDVPPQGHRDRAARRRRVAGIARHHARSGRDGDLGDPPDHRRRAGPAREGR